MDLPDDSPGCHVPAGNLPPVLRLAHDTWIEMIGHAYDGLPLEACGLLGGRPGSGLVEVFYPCGNDAASSKLYTVNSKDFLRADRDAEERGIEIIGVMHSHTHTDAFPSPTDVAQAPDPTWHYVIVSLRDTAPTLRSYRIVDGSIAEEVVSAERR